MCDLSLVERRAQACLCRRKSAVRFSRCHVGHEELPRLGGAQVCVDAHVLPLGQMGEVGMSRSENSMVDKQVKSNGQAKARSTQSDVPGANSKMEVNEMWFKNWFLNALRDEEIKGVIKQITAEAVVSVKVQVPEGKVVELERELASKDRSLKAAEDQSRRVVKQLESVERERDKAKAKQKEAEELHEGDTKRYEEAQSELRSVKGELRKLQGLAAMAGAYEQYQKLSATTRKALNGVINGKDMWLFVHDCGYSFAA